MFWTKMWRFQALFCLLMMPLVAACQSNNDPDVVPPSVVRADFAKGADVSWVTEMEADGKRFYDAQGKETDCFVLMKSLGMTAIRLRVWVNPSDGYCGKEDVLQKALRAKAQGLQVMIDFHYSDFWADPGKQTKPAAWQSYSLSELIKAVGEHTQEVLQLLKANGVEVAWVQVGNETATGMLWEEGRAADGNFDNFAQMTLAGYNATKAVYPDAKVILHVDQGDKLGRFTWLFDGLKTAGAKWDIIGMSLYPDPYKDNLSKMTSDCVANMSLLAERYGSDVMVVEIGLPWNYDGAERYLADFMSRAKAVSHCKGVFYWEPQCYGDWKPKSHGTWAAYTKGAFDRYGRPMPMLNAFR